MKTSAILVSLVALLAASACAQAETTVPLKVNRDVSFVTIKVGGVAIPDILLDTGFAFDGVLIYEPAYRDSLALAGAMEVRVPGAGSGEASKALMLDSASFRLGDLELTNQKVIVLLGDAFKGFPSNGIVGYSVFGHYVAKLDYDLGTMTLYDPGEAKIDSGWTAMPLYFKKNNIPWMDVSVVIEQERPTRLSTYIDFAASEPIELLERPGMKVGLPEKTIDAYLGTGLSGDIHGKKGNISKLIIGPYELNDVTASFAPAKVRSKQENADAVLGSGALRRFNLIFDYSNRKLYMKPNAQFNEPFSEDPTAK